MKIKEITVKNFRLLRNFHIDIEDELSLVVGKNNSGKTSLLLILEKFLNKSDKDKFSFEDFNLDFKNELCKIIQGTKTIDETTFKPIGISLRLLIKYNETDNLANINRLMMDLDPDNNTIILGFDYTINFDGCKRLKEEYNNFVGKEKEKTKKRINYKPKTIDDFLRDKQNDYFKSYKKSIAYDIREKNIIEENYIDLDSEKITLKNVINFKSVNAKRDVSNRDVDKTLSNQTSKIYKKSEATQEQQEATESFKDTLSDTDQELSKVYSTLFEDVVDTVKKFGGIKENESIIEILSTLQHRELLEGNTTVMYNHNGINLPETYNGLGYMNLISMLFEIKIILQDFKRSKKEIPAEINLLFIEEPEAHTHPQMQYVFINNIKNLLNKGIEREDGQNRKLQYIVSTHSSHIVAESDFNDIKYLKKGDNNSIIAKNLKSLEKEYIENGEEKNYKFLKQYLTLNRAELFFADKAILIEGDTERILLPAMMKKIDIEDITGTPLLSQNVSIVEVGAYSQVFEKFIDFIGAKTLIITDIDSAQNNREKCAVEDDSAVISTNSSLAFFLRDNNLSNLLSKTIEEKTLLKINTTNEIGEIQKKWITNENGHLLITYQSKELEYTARSFEDSFFHLNKTFLEVKKDSFPSLTQKWINKYLDNDDTCDVYEFADNAIYKKSQLAIEILLNSADNNYSNWSIPAYIKEGLLWLKKD